MKLLKKFCLAFVLVASYHVAQSQEISPKIIEVYGDKTQEMVANDAIRLSFLNDILQNRVKIIEEPISENEKYSTLSSVGLLNKYNPSMTREAVFNPETFNPLKYDFIFSSRTVVAYRVDNTNYLIVIEPQKIN